MVEGVLPDQYLVAVETHDAPLGVLAALELMNDDSRLQRMTLGAFPRRADGKPARPQMR